MYETIWCISYPSLYAGYIASVRRMVMDNIVLEKSSCWPWRHPGESRSYIFHEEYTNTRERSTMKLVELSINNHIVDSIHKHHILHMSWNIAQARPISVSYIPSSLQSWVSTTHRSYSQLMFFNISKYNKLTNVSCKYDRLNGWNSTLQAAWFIRHVR